MRDEQPRDVPDRMDLILEDLDTNTVYLSLLALYLSVSVCLCLSPLYTDTCWVSLGDLSSLGLCSSPVNVSQSPDSLSPNSSFSDRTLHSLQLSHCTCCMRLWFYVWSANLGLEKLSFKARFGLKSWLYPLKCMALSESSAMQSMVMTPTH